MLRYLVSFESFQPTTREEAPLLRRARQWSLVVNAKHLWDEPAYTVENVHIIDQVSTWGRQESNGRRPQGSPSIQRRRRSIMSVAGRQRMEHVARIESRKRKAFAEPLFSADQPPAFEVVPHPDEVSEPTNGCYELKCSGNEVTLALVIPRTILVKGQLTNYVRSQAGWDLVHNAVHVMYAEDGRKEAVGNCSTRRVILRIFIPFPGTYELHTFWANTPTETTRLAGVQSVNIPVEHPFCVHLTVDDHMTRSLSPSLYHASMKRFGFPRRHPLADHFGVSLLGPLRDRLRIGHVRFAVQVKQLSNSRMPATLLPQSELKPETCAVIKACNALEASGDDSSSDEASIMDSSDDDKFAFRAKAQNLQMGRRALRPGGSPGQDSRSPAFHLEPPAFVRPNDTHSETTSVVTAESDSVANASSAAVLMDSVAYCTGKLMRPHSRQGSQGEVVIAAVIGGWRRVEVLVRRRLEAPALPPDLQASLEHQGTQVSATAGAEVAKAWSSELHEAVIHLTNEDIGQLLQLVVFQVASAASFDLTDLGVGVDPIQFGADAMSPDAAYSKSSDTGVPTSRGGNSNDRGRELGTVPPPCRWVLAEFHIEDASPLPFDEDEMAKPLPP